MAEKIKIRIALSVDNDDDNSVYCNATTNLDRAKTLENHEEIEDYAGEGAARYWIDVEVDKPEKAEPAEVSGEVSKVE